MFKKVKLLETLPGSDHVKTFRFERPEGFSFLPGQFVMISCAAVKTPADIPLKRALSIASDPEAPFLEFCIALGTPQGLSHHLFFNAKNGDEFSLEGPQGNFTFSPSKNERIFIAGGTGIGPLRSMLFTLAKDDIPTTLFYGFRTPKEFLYKEEFEQYPNLRVIPAVSDYNKNDWQGEKGWISDILQKYIKDGQGKDVYLCGPSPMVEAAMGKLRELHFPEENIHREQW